jgi:flagellar protein FliS
MDADSHRLIQLLYQGALDSMAQAKGAIERSDIQGRNNSLNKAVQIVGGLRSFLDKDKGGELAQNLEQLYEYVELKLFEANVKNDAARIEECVGLIREVKTGWDEIRDEAVGIMSGSASQTAAV